MTTHTWQVGGDRLAKYLGERRWFGGKGRVIRHAEIADVIPVQWPGSQREFAVARARVATDEATSLYQLFLVDGDVGDESAFVTEALQDPAFLRGVVDAFARGATFASGDDAVRWIVASETATPLVVPPHASIRMSSTEQTNSSVFIGDQAILKLYRKLEPGLNPDVEITRFLTIDRTFAHVPALLGTIRFEDASGVTIAGMLQELVPGAIDGWTYALGRAKEHMVGGATHKAASVPFAEQSGELGAVTRALHETLASGAAGGPFEMRAATAATVTAWCQAARRTIARALDTLDAAVRDKRLARHRDDARSMLDRRAEYLQLPTSIARRIGSDAGGTARTHGDYHLGQVLRSAADRFLIIDFEGEPARPLAERRAPQSPLRDVAGMLRSFAYAAATAGDQNPRADEWERAVREAFLRAYFSDAAIVPGLLPQSRDNVRHLLTLFEAEKVFYELQYELDHRPDWVWIPMHGIASLAEAA